MSITLNGTTGITTPDISSTAAPALVGTNFTSIPAAQLTGTLPAIDASSLTGLPPAHNPVAVTGTTPSLNVGSYNFFDNGTLTGNTTVSFASVPTDAKWSYSCTLGGLNSWDISTGDFSKSFSVATQDTTPSDVFFKPDGLKMYVVGDVGDDINEYDLSTAWDVSSAVFLQLFSVATQETAPTGVSFKPDGLKMYVTGTAGQDVNEYDLSTAWDISTAVYLQLFSVATQDTSPQGVFFKPDGLKMYVVGFTGQDINEYDLSTAWDISTAVYLQLFSVATQETGPNGIFFKPDGLKMYVSGNTGQDINEYDLSTAWDISSAVYLQLFSVSGQDIYPRGVFFKPDGLKMYVIGAAADYVYQYDIGTPTSITLPASVAGTLVEGVVGERVTYDFVTSDGGTTVNLINGPATAHQSTNYDAVGTYAFLYSSSTGMANGGTYAGSSLYPAGLLTGTAVLAADDDIAGSFTRGGGAVTGTWRAMGRSMKTSGTAKDRFTLFVRIA